MLIYLRPICEIEHCKLHLILKGFQILPKQLRKNFNGSNTDGSFTTAVSNSFLSPLAQNPIAADLG